MLADLLCKFGRTVSLLPVLTRNCPNTPRNEFFVGEFSGMSHSREAFYKECVGTFLWVEVGKGGWGFVEEQNGEEEAGE